MARVSTSQMSWGCPDCGGTHIGHYTCPYIKKSCVVCGVETIMACSDCAIDGKPGVHVCGKSACRDQHEASHALADFDKNGGTSLEDLKRELGN